MKVVEKRIVSHTPHPTATALNIWNKHDAVNKTERVTPVRNQELSYRLNRIFPVFLHASFFCSKFQFGLSHCFQSSCLVGLLQSVTPFLAFHDRDTSKGPGQLFYRKPLSLDCLISSLDQIGVVGLGEGCPGGEAPFTFYPQVW